MLQRMSQKNFTESGTEDSTAEKRCDKILRLMKLDKEITYDNLLTLLMSLEGLLHATSTYFALIIKQMREGSDYDGTWIVI